MESIKAYSLDQKLRFYSQARDLFNAGFSHPQVIAHLLEIECDNETAKVIADKALPEHWDMLFSLSKQSIAEGKTYSEVIALLEKYEDDKEIVKFLVDAWYEVKTFEIECEVESPTNTLEGLQWIIISAVGIPIVFILKLSIIAKTIWIVVFIGAVIQYVVGLKQKKWAKRARNIMNHEENK